MSAQESLGPQFNYVSTGLITATTPEGQHVGAICWHPETGEVSGVSVVKAHQRQGVATRLWEQAHTEAATRGIALPQHSSRQSESGRLWSERTMAS
jgi:ribosomal protein S18 acetylase RimI-like enzyme